MRIQSSNIEMFGQSTKKEQLKIQEEKVVGSRQPDLSISHKAPILDMLGIDINQTSSSVEAANQVESSKMYEMSEEDYQKVRMLERILSELTGKEIKFILPKRLEVKDVNGNKVDINHPSDSNSPVKRNDTETLYKRRRHYSRKQSMKFSASGVVKTQDGREIRFDLKMSRNEHIKFDDEVTVNAKGQVIDPLVINYEGDLTHLTSKKYAFDLDYDGAADQVSFLEKGSGYLAFDMNDDGQINDGRELFGPSTGDGFKELAVYDEDGNGFIDEGDSIFNKLRIWNKDEDGNDVLFALGEVGVGAIYLGNVATDYALGSSPLSDDGFIRSTGMFIKESGEVGTMHHLDLSL